MNICYPGNCICDAREWEGDTDCFGNTEEDDLKRIKPIYTEFWNKRHHNAD